MPQQHFKDVARQGNIFANKGCNQTNFFHQDDELTAPHLCMLESELLFLRPLLKFMLLLVDFLLLLRAQNFCLGLPLFPLFLSKLYLCLSDLQAESAFASALPELAVPKAMMPRHISFEVRVRQGACVEG